MPIPSPYQLLSGLCFTCYLLFAGSVVQAQTGTPAPMPNALQPQKQSMTMLDGDKIYTYVEKMPAYLDGGAEGLQSFVTSHLQGGAASGPLAYVTFIIDKTGKVRRPALGANYTASEEAVTPVMAEAFRTIRQFRPGRQNGKPVNVQMRVKLSK